MANWSGWGSLNSVLDEEEEKRREQEEAARIREQFLESQRKELGLDDPGSPEQKLVQQELPQYDIPARPLPQQATPAPAPVQPVVPDILRPTRQPLPGPEVSYGFDRPDTSAPPISASEPVQMQPPPQRRPQQVVPDVLRDPWQPPGWYLPEEQVQLTPQQEQQRQEIYRTGQNEQQVPTWLQSGLNWLGERVGEGVDWATQGGARQAWDLSLPAIGMGLYANTPGYRYAQELSKDRRAEPQDAPGMAWENQVANAPGIPAPTNLVPGLVGEAWNRFMNNPVGREVSLRVQDVADRALDVPSAIATDTRIPGTGWSLAEMFQPMGEQLNQTLNPFNPNRDKETFAPLMMALTLAFDPYWGVRVAQEAKPEFDAARQAVSDAAEAGVPDAELALRNLVSGPQAVLQSLAELDPARREQRAMEMEQEAQRRYSFDPVGAGVLLDKAQELRERTPAQVIQTYMNPWAEVIRGTVADPTELVTPFIPLLVEGYKLGKAKKLFDVSPEEAARLLSSLPSPQRVQDAVSLGPKQAKEAWNTFLAPYKTTGERFMDLFPDIVPHGERTARSKAELDATKAWQAAISVLSGYTDKADVQRILSALAQSPQQLVDGIDGIVGPVAQQLRHSDGLWHWQPGLVANEEFTRRYPLLAALADRIPNFRSLKGQGNVDPLELQAELYEGLYDIARRFNGVHQTYLPWGAADVRVVRQPDGSGILEYVDKNGKVVQRTSPLEYSEAQTAAKDVKQALKDGFWRTAGKPVLLVNTLQKAFMNDAWLGFRMANWVGNALGATINALALDAYTFFANSDMVSHLERQMGGYAASPGVYALEAGKPLAQGLRSVKDEAGGSLIGMIGGKIPGPIGRGIQGFVDRLYSIPYGATELPLPGGKAIPIGEESFRLRTLYVPMQRVISGEWKRVTDETLLPLLAETVGLSPQQARLVADKVYALGTQGGKLDIVTGLRKWIGQPKLTSTLESLGVPKELISPEAMRKIDTIIAGALPSELEDAMRQISEVLMGERMRSAGIMNLAGISPGIRNWTKTGLADEAAWLIAKITEGAPDPAAVQDQAQALVKQYLDVRGQNFDRFAQELTQNENNPNTWAIAIDYLNELQAKRNAARQVVDAAGEEAVRLGTPAAWEKKWQTTQQTWQQLGADLSALTDQYRLLLQNPGEYVAQSDWWQQYNKYLQWDEVEFRKMRGIDLGNIGDVDSRTWNKVITANRDFVDNKIFEAFAAFQRYPSVENFDILRYTIERIEATGAQTAAFLAEERAKLAALVESGASPKAVLAAKRKYAKLRTAKWNTSFDAAAVIADEAAETIVAQGLAAQTQTGLRWFDPNGTEYRLVGKEGNKYRAVNADTGEVELFDAATSLDEQTPFTVPYDVVQDFENVTGGQVPADRIEQVMTQLASSRPTTPMRPPLEGIQSPNGPVLTPAERGMTQQTPIPAGTQATWRVQDSDRPVTITGVLGEQDGVRYYGIEGSNTGVPETQIIRTPAEQAMTGQAVDASGTGGTTGLANMGGMGKDIVAGLYDALYDAVAKTGKLPPQEENSLIGQVYNRLVKAGQPPSKETLDAALDIVREGGDAKGTQQAYADWWQQRQGATPAEEAAPSRTVSRAVREELEKVGPVPAADDLAQQDIEGLRQAGSEPPFAGNFEKMSPQEFADTVRQGLTGAGMSPEEVDELLQMDRRTVIDTYESMVVGRTPDVNMVDYEYTVPLPDRLRKIYDGEVTDPDLYTLLGVEDGTPFKGTLREWIGKSNQMAGAGAPQVADIAQAQVSGIDQLERTIARNLPTLLAGTPNDLTDAQKLRTIDLVTDFSPAHDQVVAVGRKVGDELSGWAMLNYGDRRDIDAVTGLIMPYWYFWSRMPMRVAATGMQKPNLLNKLYEVKRGIELENEQSGVPQRMEGTLPVPGTEYRVNVSSLFKYLLPNYAEPNPFVDPQEPGAAVLRYVPGLYPLQEAVKDGLTGQPVKPLNDLLPLPPSSIYQAATGEMPPIREGIYGWGANPNEFDPYRARRQVGIIAAQEDLDPVVVAYANQVIRNQEKGRPAGEGIPPQYLKDAQDLAQRGVRDAAKDRLVGRGTSYVTGMSAYPLTPAEQQMAQAQNAYFAAGYNPETGLGSKGLQNRIMDATPDLANWWVKSEEEPGKRGRQTDLYRQKQDLLRQKDEAVAQAMADAPVETMSKQEIFDLRAQVAGPYDEQIDAIDAELGPLRDALGDDNQDPYRGMSPAEISQRYATGVLWNSTKLPGKPQYPGDDAPKSVKDAYYDALAEWDQAQEDYVVQQLAGPYTSTSDVLRERRGNVTYTENEAREMLWHFQNDYLSDRERARIETLERQQDQYDAADKAHYRNAQERIPAGEGYLKKYLDTPKDQREALKAQDWRYAAVTLAAYNPDIYDGLAENVGEDAAKQYYEGKEAKPQWPGENATQAELDAYYKKLNAFNAKYPLYEEAAMYLWGRQRWGTFDSSSEPGQYNAGSDYAKAKELFGEDIFDLLRAGDAASAAGTWSSWRDNNPEAYKRVLAYNEWRKALAGEPTSAAMLPKAVWGVNPAEQTASFAPGDPRQGLGPANLPQRGFLPFVGVPETGTTPGGTVPEMGTTPGGTVPEMGTTQMAGIQDPDILPGSEGDAVNAYAMQNESYAEWEGRKQSVYATFGPETGALYEQYLALPKGEPRRMFKAEHPELRAVSLYTWNPNEYGYLVQTYGADAVMAWAQTPAYADTDEARARRNAYYDQHPEAWEINAWLYGRPGGDESETTDDETFSYDFGEDYAQAIKRFGPDIWSVVGNYKRGWDKEQKARYFDQYPVLSDFFDWWYANLPGSGYDASGGYGRGYGSYASYSGGGRYYSRGSGRYYGGGGYSFADPEEAEMHMDVRINPLGYDPSLRVGLEDIGRGRAQPRPRSGQTPYIGPDPIRKWMPPRWH